MEANIRKKSRESNKFCRKNKESARRSWSSIEESSGRNEVASR